MEKEALGQWRKQAGLLDAWFLLTADLVVL